MLVEYAPHPSSHEKRWQRPRLGIQRMNHAHANEVTVVFHCIDVARHAGTWKCGALPEMHSGPACAGASGSSKATHDGGEAIRTCIAQTCGSAGQGVAPNG